MPQIRLIKEIRSRDAWAESVAGGGGAGTDDRDSSCRNLAY